MNDIQQYFLVGMAAIAVLDRFLCKRKQVVLLGAGEGVVKDNAIAFPVKFKVNCEKLTGAHIEYWLRDSSNPTAVITGKTRTLDLTPKGLNQEYLLIDTRYLDTGTWELTIRITHGNSRMNPLYRIFPLQESTSRNYRIKKEKGGYSVIN
ncbi:lysis protein [Citrobacter freundii]|uniref:Lysis protein n=1 Tax=Citrobacter freundii TaxID=546 RepID=A0ABY7L862_CITFR|nr:lysis protein [Citrobacter freundii]EIJ9084807.1 lysis protein [Citrobacter freundii]EJH9549598.1 lysis protein [Citrobacter freundii]EJO6485733.1 lysis protein [Citrobacter freundii]EKW5688183.1 lysis protein [Citrobacter freundii]EKX9690319.1 lysis protein [Citrobacter freundii]